MRNAKKQRNKFEGSSNDTRNESKKDCKKVPFVQKKRAHTQKLSKKTYAQRLHHEGNAERDEKLLIAQCIKSC